MPEIVKEDPGSGDVHVNGPDWRSRRKPKPADGVGAAAILAGDQGVKAVIGKAGDPQPLYVNRPVVNAAELIAWAKGQGFETTLPADEMHVTIAYSRSPVDWMACGESWSGDPKGQVKITPGGPRQLAAFGPQGDAAVLLFASNDLSWRHSQLEDAGCSWDWPDFSPHITISFSAVGLDLSTLKPYQGEIVLGPESFEPLVENWKDDLVEKSFEVFCKVSSVVPSLGLVFGWGIVCKVGGVDYVDSQNNHVPEDAMVEATSDFMKSARVHGDMHVRGTTEDLPAGVVVHSMPLATDMWKGMWTNEDGSWPASMPAEPPRTGWFVATAPDPAMLAKFASGEYTGFSIGGHYLEIDGKPVGASA